MRITFYLLHHSVELMCHAVKYDIHPTIMQEEQLLFPALVHEGHVMQHSRQSIKSIRLFKSTQDICWSYSQWLLWLLWLLKMHNPMLMPLCTSPLTPQGDAVDPSETKILHDTTRPLPFEAIGIFLQSLL